MNHIIKYLHADHKTSIGASKPINQNGCVKLIRSNQPHRIALRDRTGHRVKSTRIPLNPVEVADSDDAT
jgi:hypothetical protein